MIKVLGTALLSLSSLSAQTADTWFLADGKTFEGQVRSVTPGVVLFSRPSGPDASVEINKLSEASRKRLIEILGLNTSATPKSATAPAVGTVPFVTRNSGAIDSTDTGMLESQFGKKATVIGKVAEVITLGTTGHKRINFEGTEFNIFINKRVLEKNSNWNLNTLTGKTVQIRGEIAKYQNQLQIQITDPSQIGAVER